MGYQPFAELHDAHDIRWLTVIGQDELGYPEIAAAHYSPHREAFLVWLGASTLLNVASSANALARLRIIENGILVVDFMFGLEIAGIRRIPMALQRRACCSIVHLDLPYALRHIPDAQTRER